MTRPITLKLAVAPHFTHVRLSTVAAAISAAIISRKNNKAYRKHYHMLVMSAFSRVVEVGLAARNDCTFGFVLARGGKNRGSHSPRSFYFQLLRFHYQSLPNGFCCADCPIARQW